MLGRSVPQLRHECENDLVSGARNNDEAAIRSITRSHNPNAVPTCAQHPEERRRGGRRGSGRLCGAFTGLSAFHGEARIGTWPGRIVVNERPLRTGNKRCAPWSSFDFFTPTEVGVGSLVVTTLRLCRPRHQQCSRRAQSLQRPSARWSPFDYRQSGSRLESTRFISAPPITSSDGPIAVETSLGWSRDN